MENTFTKKSKNIGGFTLIELLVVIGIIAILAAIVIVAINPSRQFAQARNTQRESNVSTILNAIGQNIADNKGIFDPDSECDNIPSTADEIGEGTTEVDLTDCLIPTYISTGIPFDPDGGSETNTLYTVAESSSGQITVCAPKHDEAGILDAGTYCLTR